MGIAHIVWDWNGTLLDDFDVVLQACNASCSDLLGRSIDAEEYRTHFARPVQLLYEGIFGRPLAAAEWQLINSRFHASYEDLVATAVLVRDAEAALRMAADAGCTQSLLSMWLQDELVMMLDALRVGSEFVRVTGVGAIADGGSKHQHLAAHLEQLSGDLDQLIDPATVLVIGDSLDDAAAAEHVGARCVLVEGGCHHAADLAAAGVPVVRSLLGALNAGLERTRAL